MAKPKTRTMDLRSHRMSICVSSKISQLLTEESVGESRSISAMAAKIISDHYAQQEL